MVAIVISKRTEGQATGIIALVGGGEKNIFLASVQTAPAPWVDLSSFDTNARWQPVTQSARSRRSYEKKEDRERSSDKWQA